MAALLYTLKKEIFKGITNLSKASTSPNRIWLKLDKSFFGFEKDLFLCAVNIPPYNFTHLDDDFQNLENEIVKFSVKGEIALIDDFNARVSDHTDFINQESYDSHVLQDILPPNYDDDIFVERNSQDQSLNCHGKSLLNMCISSRLRILNGRFIGDSLGYFTCYTFNGCSTVDYGLVSKDLLSSVKYFCTKS